MTDLIRKTSAHTRALIRSPYALIVLTASLTYSVSFSTLSFIKYYTFNATYEDLGIENQTQWLLSHGWISSYYGSGFYHTYPLQFQKPILFLVTPFYAIYPHPETLLVLGSLSLGLAALPLYVYATRRLENRLYGMVIALSYLVFFSVASANLFDFHEENFFPLFFFTMIAAWAIARPKLMYFAAALTAAVNPLCLVIVVLFLYFTSLEPVSANNPLRVLFLGTQKFLRDRTRVLFTLGLLVVLSIYAVTGYLFTPGVGGAGSQSSLPGILFFDVNSKVQTIVYLYAALAFVPLFAWRAQLVVLPYIGYALYSTNPANWAPFGLMYPLMATGPLYLALGEAIRNAQARNQPERVEGPVRARLPKQKSLVDRHHRGETAISQKMVLGLVVASTVFGVVYFPFSPVNQYVTGGYFDGNHDLSGITTITPQVKFLWSVINLVPSSASVLSQNDIPGITGRQHSQIDVLYNPNVPYNYLLMDSSFSYFSSPTTIIPFANADLQSNGFGVVAEGQGALLLAKDFEGPPILYEPFNETYIGSDMTLYSGSAVGTTLVGNESSYSFWYGPYATLYPGRYQANFVLSSNRTTPSSTTSITIDVVSSGGSDVYSSRTLDLGNFTAPGIATSFDLTFNVTSVVTGIEFRGMFPTGASRLTMLSVDVSQLSTSL